jgi:FkbH-like protein
MISGTEAARRRDRGLSLAEVDATGVQSLRVFVLGTFNLDLFPPFLVEALDRAGIHSHVELAPFGQLAQELANPESAFYTAAPDAVLIVPATEDLFASLYAGTGAAGLVDERIDELERLLAGALGRLPEATFFVVAFGADEVPAPHVLEPTAPQRGQVELERFLEAVRGLGRMSPRIVVVDWEWPARAGGAAYRDPRLWYLARMRLNPQGLAALADSVTEHVAAWLGLTRKVLAVDLDGVLWGGIAGEVGVGGIELGEDGLGLAYRDLQDELRKLVATGVVLAACSKNNPGDVDAIFEGHPAMRLRRDDFAAIRANWDDKASNLRALADELELGIDTFVFFDDNPVEREWVRTALPEVVVPDLPKDPAQRPGFLRAAPWFRRISVTDADAGRTRSYQAQGRRRDLRATATSFEQFLSELKQEVAIERLQEASLARAAQLAQRTNQFNLTTMRYTAAELEAVAGKPSVEAYTVGLSDRFGDSGITGLAIVRFAEEAAEIDTFLLSCRVLGRRLEDAVLAFLAERARERGARFLIGRYVETPRNEQVRSFYPERGFEADYDGTFRLDLEHTSLEWPAAIAVKAASRA